MHVIQAPDEQDILTPLLFLAGPIQGADNWQDEIIDKLKSISNITIANPRRDYLDGEFVYEKQVDWESKHLRIASRDGAILFWLANEAEKYPGRAYAQTTRYELAEWLTKAVHFKAKPKIFLGIDSGFSGAKYIRHRCSQDNPDIEIVDTLDELAKQVQDSWTQIQTSTR